MARGTWMCRTAGSLLLGASLLTASAGCRTPLLAANDVIVPQNGPGLLSASLTHQPILGMCKDFEHVAVRFFVAGQDAGLAHTDQSGLAALACLLAPGVQRYEVRVLTEGRELQAYGRVFTWDSQRVAIAVDVDGTIAETRRRRLLVNPEDPSAPVPHAAETLT